MMKKDIRYIAMGVAFATVALAGCSQFQEDNLFDESAALRIEHNAEKLQNILVDAPNGWVLQYYTGRGISVFEGFNLFAKFERSGKVTLAGDHRFLRNGNAGKYTEHSSLYELIREDGLVLAFNTWNDVLTPFVDPVAFWAAPDILVKDGEGMQGDQNLVVKFMSENQIILRGERYDAEVRLVKADRDWQTYIADTKAMKERFTSDEINSYYITAGDQTMYVVGLKNGRYRISERVKNPLKVDSLSCCFTPYGFRNESVDTLAGHIFQEFKMAEDGSALLSEDGSVRIIATWDTNLAESDEVMWFDGETLSADLKAKYDQLMAVLETANKVYSPRIGIGRSALTSGANGVVGLVIEWYSNRRLTKPSLTRGGLTMKRSVPVMGQMTITYEENSTTDNDMKDLLDKDAALVDLVRGFAAALAGTYQMTPNNNFVPTEVLFQSLEGESSFKLKKDEE
ncbi:MAG: DUF4302 domain-containing protein [Bacteroidaceae bacterium]|nr:DUF4302 domain-containing protein [Bacteroidaceae bacterium]